MKAPDKIYAEINENGFVCGYDEPTKKDDIEYIRKDALLEWAKDEVADKQEEPDVWSSGFRFALNVFINKLNSL